MIRTAPEDITLSILDGWEYTTAQEIGLMSFTITAGNERPPWEYTMVTTWEFFNRAGARIFSYTKTFKQTIEANVEETIEHEVDVTDVYKITRLIKIDVAENLPFELGDTTFSEPIPLLGEELVRYPDFVYPGAVAESPQWTYSEVNTRWRYEPGDLFGGSDNDYIAANLEDPFTSIETSYYQLEITIDEGTTFPSGQGLRIVLGEDRLDTSSYVDVTEVGTTIHELAGNGLNFANDLFMLVPHYNPADFRGYVSYISLKKKNDGRMPQFNAIDPEPGGGGGGEEIINPIDPIDPLDPRDPL